MGEIAAALFWLALLAYLAAGFLLWTWLIAGGLQRLDRSAQDAPLRVKALLTPGLIALWPLILRRLWVRPQEDLL